MIGEAAYDIYVKQSEAVLARIYDLDRKLHEHSSDCEMRCPKESERKSLFSVLDDIAQPFIDQINAVSEGGSRVSEGITKAELRILEKMFAREIDLALKSNTLPPIYQSRAKILLRLVEKGLVEAVEYEIAGAFPITIKGYLLTHSGRFTYCANC